MSKLDSALDRLLGAGCTIALDFAPEQGQNRCEAAVVNADESVLAKFDAASKDELVDLLDQSSREAGSSVQPSAAVVKTLTLLREWGSGARFAAIDTDGSLAINDIDQPVFHRQRKAAHRNGQQNGAVAVYDFETGVVEPIESLAKVS